MLWEKHKKWEKIELFFILFKYVYKLVYELMYDLILVIIWVQINILWDFLDEMNEIKFTNLCSRNVDGILYTSIWFQTSWFPIVAECGSLHKIKTNANLLINWKEDSRLLIPTFSNNDNKIKFDELIENNPT